MQGRVKFVEYTGRRTLANDLSRSAIERLLSERLSNGPAAQPDDVVVAGPVYSGINSRVFRVKGRQLPYECALKLCLKDQGSKPDPQVARRQFKTLQNLAGLFPTEHRYRVTRPYLLMEEHGALLVEWISGRKLSDILFGFGCTYAQACDLLEHSALWLQRFHTGYPRQPDTLDTDFRLQNLEDAHQTNLIKDCIFNRGHGLLTSQAQVLGQRKLACSWVHGDFKSDNLIFSEAHVFGIDIHARHEHVVITDLAHFLNHIELNLSLCKSPGLVRRKDELFRHFLESYFGASRAFEEMLLPLAWLRVCMLLQTWCNVHLEDRNPIRRRLVERQYRAATAKVIHSLERG